VSGLRLNLGCGQSRMESWTGVDRVAGPAVDLVHDLDVGPWPWGDESVERILASDVFEHVGDAVMFMVECHRVLEDNSPLFIKTPHYLHRDAYTDPTHRRFPTEHTFDYWVPGTQLYEQGNAAYGAVGFRPGPLWVGNGSIQLTLFKANPREYRHIAAGVHLSGGIPRDPNSPPIPSVPW
jgi:hypothetical protein